jgi:WD40 repeat protein
MLNAHPGNVSAVAISPDGNWIASGGSDGTLRIWNMSSSSQRAMFDAHPGNVSAVAISPDGNWIASGGSDGTLRIWNMSSSSQSIALEGHSGPVTTVAISPDGNWLAAGSIEGTVRIWGAIGGKPQAFMRAEGAILSCVWLDLERLVVGGPAGLYSFEFFKYPAKLQDDTNERTSNQAASA